MNEKDNITLEDEMKIEIHIVQKQELEERTKLESRLNILALFAIVAIIVEIGIKIGLLII